MKKIPSVLHVEALYARGIKSLVFIKKLLYLSDSKLTPRWLYSELWDQKLRLQSYAAIRQRIDMNIVLNRLDRAETGKYIAAHMAYAGIKQDLFTSGAEDEIFKVSAGIPRMINRICEKTLMYAYQQQKRLIDEHMVRFVDLSMKVVEDDKIIAGIIAKMYCWNIVYVDTLWVDPD